MSGPKGMAYRVQAEAEARRRAEEAARARCRALATRIAHASDTLANLSGETTQRSRVPHLGNQTLESLQEIEQRLNGELDAVQQALADAEVRLVCERFAQEFGSLHALTLDAPEAVVLETTRAPDRTQQDANRVRASLARVITLVQQVTDDAVRQSLARRAVHIHADLEAGSTQGARQQLLALQTEANAALGSQQSRELLRREAARVVLGLADVPGREAAELRGLAGGVAEPAQLDDLARRAAAVVAGHEADQDRAFVIQEARRALVDLGYELGEDFEVASLNGQATIATRPDLRDHGLRLQFPATAARLLTRVVTFGEPDAARDAEVEALTCHDVEAMQAAFQAQGIEAHLDHHRAPGEVPMTREGPVRRATRRAAADRERPL